jgi:hypothetical protein
MNATGLLKYSGAVVTLALLSACGGGSTVSPSMAGLNIRYVGKTLFLNGRPVTAARLSPTPRYATILPDRHTTSTKFEYVMGIYDTSIFDYPKGVQQIGTISNAGGQGCTNVLYGFGKGYFWIVSAYNQIEEFKVLKKPIKTLSVSEGIPSSCAMDTSGDLAVGILFGSGGGAIVIFKNSGSGIVIGTPLAEEYFDGYDNNGNLFADGINSSGQFELIELPKGSSTSQQITTSNTVEFPGSVQWDGKYLTVFDQEANATYQYTVSGTTATLKGTVSYSGSSDCAQTWIVPGLVYCADAGNNDAEVFKYPAGGSAIAVLTGSFTVPLGAVAAKK